MSNAAPDIRTMQEHADATFVRFGADDSAVEIVDTFGAYEAEYAAIRKGVGLFACPHRGVIEVRGRDQLAFLHAMVTNDTKGLAEGSARRAFLLNKQGRIDADLLIARFAADACCRLLLDRADAASVTTELEKYLFSEDVQLQDASAAHHVFALHGPAALQLLAAVCEVQAPALDALTCATANIAGAICHVVRQDQAGAAGVHVMTPTDAAANVYARLAEALGGLFPDVEGGKRRAITGRGVGWLAFNTARIEAGSPLYHIDFGPDSLPAETGVLPEAVSFTKGCYLGQEIVARMHNLGHPKKVLVGLRMHDERMPETGAAVTAAGEPNKVIGAVTSATVAPMLGNTAIALAMVKWGSHTPGVAVEVAAEGGRVAAKVQGLGFIDLPQ